MAESSSNDGEAVRDTTSNVLQAGLKGGAFSFVISTSSVLVVKEICRAIVGVTKELVGANANAVEITERICGTVVKLAALYTGYKLLRPVIDEVIKKGLGGERDDQDVRDITPGSLHVLLCCSTDERFLEVLEDYESGRIKERLEKEFSEVGIEVEGLKVEIENMEEVEKTKAAANKRANSTDKKTVQDTTSHVLQAGLTGGAYSFIVRTGNVLLARALSGIAIEVMKELGATAIALAKRSAVGTVFKPPLHELGETILPLQGARVRVLPSLAISSDTVLITKVVAKTAVTLGALYTCYTLLRPVIDAAVTKALGDERDDLYVRDFEESIKEMRAAINNINQYSAKNKKIYEFYKPDREARSIIDRSSEV